MGKWTDLLRALNKLPDSHKEGGEKYQDKVREAAAKIKERKLSEVAKAYELKRIEEDQTEEKAKAIRLQLRALELLLEAGFEGEGVTLIRLESGSSIGYQPEPHTVVKDEQVFREWCLSQPDIAPQMKLLWQTTNSIAKQLLDGGKPLPPGLDCFAKPKFVLRQG